MATLFQVSNPLSHTLTTFTSLRALPFPNSPALHLAVAGHRKPRGLAVITRAGPSANSYIFAFALPFSLLAVTIFASLRMGEKLDRDFLEEMAMNEAMMEVDEDDDDDDEEDINDDMETFVQEAPSMETFVQKEKEEPVLPRTRNRPKREA